MKKLSLKLDDLHVETFTTAERLAGRGTVQGHYGTTHTQAGETCGFGFTCGAGSGCQVTACHADCSVSVCP
jgi:hypothetical protein